MLGFQGVGLATGVAPNAAPPLAAVAIGGIAITALVFVVGLAFVAGGFLGWRRKRLLEDTPRESVEAIAVGRTEVDGEAYPIGEATPRPFQEGDCVVSKWELEVYVDRNDSSGWNSASDGIVGGPFELDDGTGRVRVEPVLDDESVLISDEKRVRQRFDGGEEAPPAARDFLERETSVGEDGFAGYYPDRPKRLTEYTIEPGDHVYVFGGAKPRDEDAIDDGASNAERLVIGRDPDSDYFVVSDRTEEDITNQLGRWAPWLILFGLLTSAFGLWGVLSIFGLPF